MLTKGNILVCKKELVWDGSGFIVKFKVGGNPYSFVANHLYEYFYSFSELRKANKNEICL